MSRIGRKLLEGLGFKFLAVVLATATFAGLIVIVILWAVGKPS